MGAWNEVMTTRNVAAALDKVAKDYPDLPKEKYGYNVLSDD